MEFITSKLSNDRLEPEPRVLYVVGTPIGNLNDFSDRAKSILRSVSYIACEDTRRSGILLKSFHAKTPLISFHQHNIQKKIPKIINLLEKGNSLGLISDAGLPGISDPGQELVSVTKSKGYKVICIPGACAAVTALVSSGLPTNRFCFEGFLPTKDKDRKKILEGLSNEERTTIIYESPHRILKLLEDLSNSCGLNRPLEVSRELTKRYEENIGTTIGEVINHLKQNKPKGEFTLVLGGVTRKLEADKTHLKLIYEIKSLINEGKSTSESIRKVSEKYSYSRRTLYEILHKECKT
tara:strand:- start:1781 stop:2665 length:885 start_codon:yes stop_codon:yes gene_type:complete